MIPSVPNSSLMILRSSPKWSRKLRQGFENDSVSQSVSPVTVISNNPSLSDEIARWNSTFNLRRTPRKPFPEFIASVETRLLSLFFHPLSHSSATCCFSPDSLSVPLSSSFPLARCFYWTVDKNEWPLFFSTVCEEIVSEC